MQTISIKNTWVWFKDQMTHPSTLFSKTSWGVFSPYAHYHRSDHRPKQTYATREKALSVAKEMGMKYGGSYSIYKTEYRGRFDEIPGLYSLMNPIPGAIEAMQRMQKDERIDMYVISTAPWNNPSSWTDKLL